MRQIVLDTETTGVDPASGHRIVEIGCVEMVFGARTGKFFHTYLNPERDMPEEAFRVHGLSLEFLIDKPIFAQQVDAFLEFIGDAQLVIHNAAFDMKFINAELERAGFSPISFSRAIDTVLIARKKFPGSPANLDALCKRFNIDLSARTKHGALLDAELLSEVYIELSGGKQVALTLDPHGQSAEQGQVQSRLRPYREARQFAVSEQELASHLALLAKIKKPLWQEDTA